MLGVTAASSSSSSGLPSAQLLESSPVPGGPGVSDKCTCCFHVPETCTRAQRTWTWLAPQAATDQALPSTAPAYTAHVRHKCGQPPAETQGHQCRRAHDPLELHRHTPICASPKHCHTQHPCPDPRPPYPTDPPLAGWASLRFAANTRTPHTPLVWGRYQTFAPSSQHPARQLGQTRAPASPISHRTGPFHTPFCPLLRPSLSPSPAHSPTRLHSPTNPTNTLHPQLYIPNSCKVPTCLRFHDSPSISVT